METEVSLNLFINEAQRKVVFAESDCEFVEVLLSFLVKPIGAAVKLAGGKSGLGGMDALYRSVESLDVKHFSTEACKKMLLHPVDASTSCCHGLTVPINDKCLYFRCPDWRSTNRKHRFWSAVKGTKCSCGKTMDVVRCPTFNSGENPSGAGLFLRGNDKFLITDDLRVIYPIPTISMDELRKFGVQDLSLLKEKKVEVGKQEVVNLFKHSLMSNTPLTDTFIVKIKKEGNFNMEALETSSLNKAGNVEEKKMTMNLAVSKLTGKVLYGQFGEDVVNFFFSFLTFPLGLASSLLNGKSSVGCIDHLWSSAKLLDEKGHLRTSGHSKMLLKPMIAPHHSCKDQPLKVEEDGTRKMMEYNDFNALNLKSTSFTTEKGGNFVSGPTTFMISDQLEVKMASVSEGISILRNYYGVEVITVTLGELEALMLLKAALTSSTPLTTVFIEQLELRKSLTKTIPPANGGNEISNVINNTPLMKKAKIEDYE